MSPKCKFVAASVPACMLYTQESYGLMAKFQISVAKEETEMVDTMRFAWQKLNTAAVSHADYTHTCSSWHNHHSQLVISDNSARPLGKYPILFSR